jgi:predicted kinase
MYTRVSAPSSHLPNAREGTSSTPGRRAGAVDRSSYAARARRPYTVPVRRLALFVVQMAGVMGAGKSALAAGIARETGAAVVDLDVVKSAALEAGAAWDLSGKIAYTVLWAVADSLLAQGHSVILDSPCRYENIIAQGQAMARRRGATYAFVECVLADTEEQRRRVRERARLRSQMPELAVPPPDAPRDAYHALMDASGALVLETKYPDAPWLSVDTSQSPERCLALALEHLAARCAA